MRMLIIGTAALGLLLSGTANAKGGGHSGRSHSTGSHGLSSGSRSGGDAHYVRGYTKKDGTYVAPHRQTNPNGTKADNWSSKGNVNPDTGKEGTKDPNR